MALIDIPLNQLVPDPNQPRKVFAEAELKELAASLSVMQMVAIIVVKLDGMFRILDGERRYRAALLGNLKSLRAEVLETIPSPAELRIHQVIINSQREGLTSVELLHAYEELLQHLKCSPSELADRLGVSKSKVTRILALRRLTDEELNLVRSGDLPSACAYAISRMDEPTRAEALRLLKEGKLSREDAERLSTRKRPSSTEARRKTVSLHAMNAAVRVSSIQGLNIDELITVFTEIACELKKARKQGLDIRTACMVLHDVSNGDRGETEVVS